METPFSCGLVWLRRDLRVSDHAALHQALKHCQRVHVAFVFDTEILDALPRADRRVEFIRESLVEVDARLRELAGHPQAGLIVRHGVAKDKIVKLAQHLQAQVVFANHDDEPLALARDIQVRGHLADHGIVLHTYKDHVVFERNEVLTQMAKPFSVFTPYKNAWLKKITPDDLQAFEVAPLATRLAPRPDDLAKPVPSLADMGFEPTNLQALKIPTGESGAQALLQDFLTRIDQYEDTRNFPAVKGPSYLSVHLRFGTVSIRQLAREAHARARVTTGVSEHHALDGHGGSHGLVDTVQLAVGLCLVQLPGGKHGLHRAAELGAHVLRKRFAGVLQIEGEKALAQLAQLAEVQQAFVPAQRGAADFVFEQGARQTSHHLAIGGDQAAVSVPHQARVACLAQQAGQRCLAQAHVEQRLHHAGHGHGRTRTH